MNINNNPSSDDIRRKRIKRQIIMISSLFCVLILAIGVISYNLAANMLREQTSNKISAETKGKTAHSYGS